MSKANPLWGAPRIHGELLKLGINISQATVGRWMPWRPKVPSDLPRPTTSLPSRRLVVCTIAMSVEPLEQGRMFLLAPSNCRQDKFEQGQYVHEAAKPAM